MKKILLTGVFFLILFLVPFLTFAQLADHTAREEAEGKTIWEKLQSKELECQDLSKEDFAALGEYFMGQMMGNSHEVMNNTLIKMMGEEGEGQMHLALGKRMSNCEPNASMPQNMMGDSMPATIMKMMMGGLMSPLRQGFREQEGGDKTMMGPGIGTGEMMGNWASGWFWGLYGLLAFVTWLALIVFLLSAARYFWRKK